MKLNNRKTILLHSITEKYSWFLTRDLQQTASRFMGSPVDGSAH